MKPTLTVIGPSINAKRILEQMDEILPQIVKDGIDPSLVARAFRCIEHPLLIDDFKDSEERRLYWKGKEHTPLFQIHYTNPLRLNNLLRPLCFLLNQDQFFKELIVNSSIVDQVKSLLGKELTKPVYDKLPLECKLEVVERVHGLILDFMSNKVINGLNKTHKYHEHV